MKSRQPVTCKVPNPTNESKDEGMRNFYLPVFATGRFFASTNEKKGEFDYG